MKNYLYSGEIVIFVFFRGVYCISWFSDLPIILSPAHKKNTPPPPPPPQEKKSLRLLVYRYKMGSSFYISNTHICKTPFFFLKNLIWNNIHYKNH